MAYWTVAVVPVSLALGTVPATQRSELGFWTKVNRRIRRVPMKRGNINRASPAGVYHDRKRLPSQSDVDVVRVSIIDVQGRRGIGRS